MFAGLEFSVYVACIFNERFMNKGQSITKDNIDQLEAEMKMNLKYFKDWIISAHNQKGTERYKNKKENWTECCIDKKTYNNLRIQICGFFFYARKILEYDERVKYIPFLFSNTSSLESFSLRFEHVMPILRRNTILLQVHLKQKRQWIH